MVSEKYPLVDVRPNTSGREGIYLHYPDRSIGPFVQSKTFLGGVLDDSSKFQLNGNGLLSIEQRIALIGNSEFHRTHGDLGDYEDFSPLDPSSVRKIALTSNGKGFGSNETEVFRTINYHSVLIKHHSQQILASSDSNIDLTSVEGLVNSHRNACLILDSSTEANIALAVSAVTKYTKTNGISYWRDELESSAFEILQRSVRYFNSWRGIKFSTYFMNAAYREFVRVKRKLVSLRDSGSTILEVVNSESMSTYEHVDATELYGVVTSETNPAELTDLERFIIYKRFISPKKETLEAIGNQMNISKSKIGQSQKRALGKIKDYYEKTLEESEQN